MKAVYKRELKSSFDNMTGYVIAALILLFMGIYTLVNNFIYGAANFEYAVSSMGLIYLFAAVFITMGSFSTERRRKTDQLLFTSPASLSGIVAGKYFAMLTVFALPTVIICIYPLILSLYGDVNFAAAYAAIFSLFMLGAAITAIGMFVSSLTENIIISAAVSLGTLLVIYFFDSIASIIPVSPGASLVAFLLLSILIAIIIYAMTKSLPLSLIVLVVLVLGITAVYLVNDSLFNGLFPALVSKLALFSRFSGMTTGLFDLTVIILYISTAVLFSFLTKGNLEKRRWS